ncbi:MAG: porin family protein [Weeksellaceae bacterium]|nr:porin family protein [Weeksellaceae bacterium]
MKKILFSALMLVFAGWATAQITYGPKAGLNITNLTDIHGDSGPRYGFYAGGFASIPIGQNDQFYFQPELLYSQQGEKNESENVDELYKLDYLQIPLLFKAYFSENDTEFFGVFGPQVGFLINSSVDTGGRPQHGGHVNDEYRNIDVGVTAGLGFSYNRQIEFDVRYFYGLMDVVPNDARGHHNRTSILSLGFAYRFGLN